MVAVAHTHVEANLPGEQSAHSMAVRTAFTRAHAAMTDAIIAFAEFDAHGGWHAEGYGSATSWLAANAGLTQTDAARTVRDARLLRQHPRVQHALRSGAITLAHVSQLSSIARHRSRRFADDVVVLIDAATEVAPEEFRKVATRWPSMADDVLAPEERDERNFIDLAQTYAGTWVLRGVLDPVRGATLHRIVTDRSAPIDADDPRPASERRADALFEALTGSQPVDPRVDVLVDIDTFTGTDRPLAEVRCELQGIGEIDRVLMERLACNPRVGRVLVRGRSEVLDLGRSVRLASPAQRRAVIARDQHCAWPNCNRLPSMCEIHHIVPWQQGGPTDLENLALLCGTHHSRVHQGWRLSRTEHATWESVPPPSR